MKEHKLNELEGRYKLLFEGSPDAILLIAPDNIIIDCNAGAEKLLEQSRQFIIGTNFESFYQKNIISDYSFSELYTMMVEGKAPQPLEIEIKTKNGTHEWYKIFSNILTIQAPYPHIQLYIRKITERKKKEAQLRNDTLDSLFLANISSELSGIQHENDVFRFISDHLKIILPDTVVLINRSDPDGNNLVTEELLGVSLDEAVYLTKLVGEELTDSSFNTSDVFKDRFSRPVLQHMGNSFYEFCNHKISQKTSGIIDSIFKTNAIHTIAIADHGQYFGFIHIFSSAKNAPVNQWLLESFVYLCYLTIARIRSVNALTESEKTYRFLADNVRDVIFTLDLKLNYTYVSPSVKILRGYESSELIGKSILNSLSPESSQIVTGIFLSETENIRLNKPIHAVEKLFEVELLHKEGYTFWAEIKASFILDEDKNPVGILGITRDIKERKLVEQKLLEKNRELNEANAHKNKFFSIIAHDLKNPFGNILNFSGLLKEQYHKFPEAKQLQFISLIHKSSEQIYHLLENLLDWSRSQGGKMDFFPQVIDLGKILHEIVEFTASSAQTKNIKIEINAPASFVIDADSYMLKTVLRNLMANAIKYTPEGGKVYVNATLNGGNVTISVSDTGIGMDSEVSDSLFKIEGNISRPGTHGEKGTGLGLLLCKEFIDAHKGRIWVQSSPNNGSTFWIVIPSKQNT